MITQPIPIFQLLDQRRRELEMTYAILAKRSCVSVPTVCRILSGSDPGASFANVQAVAEAQGMGVSLTSESNPEEFRFQQAQRKARRLVGIVQGTAGLEGQAVDADAVERMRNRTVHELLAGSPRKLWGD